MRLRHILTAAGMVLGSTQAAQAQTLFTTGLPTYDYSVPINTEWGASLSTQFTLSNPVSMVTGLRFWYAIAKSSPTLSGATANYAIWADNNGGNPPTGSPLLTGSTPVSTATSTAAGNIDWDAICIGCGYGMWSVWRATFNVAPTLLGAGSYFLQMDVANSGDTGEVDWATTSSYGGMAWNAAPSPDGAGAFEVRGYDPTAAPEPATMTLLGSGLVGLAGFARRRRQRTQG